VKTQNIVIKKQRCSVERLPSIENYSDFLLQDRMHLKWLQLCWWLDSRN